MKKFLSLAPVTISAGDKDFTNDSKIAYQEAVDAVSAVGIIDGSFNPSATLTHSAAAKIICNLMGPPPHPL